MSLREGLRRTIDESGPEALIGATQVATGSPHNNTLSGNVQVSGTSWPSGAQTVINQSGVGGSTPPPPGSGPLHAVGAGKCLDDPSSSTTP